MRWLLFTALVFCACGQPEDLLVIQGSLSGVDGGDAGGRPLALYRDLGGTELGCSAFSPWRELTAGEDGGFRVEHVRQETAGRFGLTRCLRLEWRDGARTASFSWRGAARDTQLPPLLAWFDAPDVVPVMPQEMGSATAPAPSFEVADARGVVFRQPLIAPLATLLDGPGPAPAVDARVVLRRTQRVQVHQDDALAADPLLVVEYRIDDPRLGFVGNAAHVELAHGAACGFRAPGSDACAFTDGLFTPVDVGSGVVELRLREPVALRTVVVRGIGAVDPWTTLVVEAREDPQLAWAEGARVPAAPAIQLLATGSLEDPRPVLFLVAHWIGFPGPVAEVRVRIEDSAGAAVPIGWLGEVSIY